jgi:acyl-CoA thioester hydrolase
MITVRDRVRFVETDLMGVVHHANYFRWFEAGRVEYLRQAGVLLPDLLAAGIVFPILDVSCQYHAPARFDEIVAIETKMAQLSPVKMIFTYRVTRDNDGVLLATGRTQNVFTNNSGKIIRLPSCYYEKLQAFLGILNGRNR